MLRCILLVFTFQLILFGQGDRASGADEPFVWRPKELKQAYGSEFGHHWWEVYAVDFAHDGKWVVSGGGDNRIYIWNANTLAPITFSDRLSGTVQSVAVHPNGQQIAAGLEDGSIRLFDFRNNRLVERHRLTGHGGRLTALCYAAKGTRLLAASSHAGNTYLYDTSGSNPVELHVLPGVSGWEMDASADGEIVAIAQSNKLTVWRVTDTSHKLIAEEASTAFSVSVSEDGKMIAVGGSDQQPDSLTLWRVGESELTPIANWSPEIRGVIVAVQISPDGKWLASSTAYANKIHLWDLNELPDAPIALEGHKSKTFNLAFSCDSKTLASAGADFSVRLWDVDNACEAACSKDSNRIHVTFYSGLWYSRSRDEWLAKANWRNEKGKLTTAIVSFEKEELQSITESDLAINLSDSHELFYKIVSPDAKRVATLLHRKEDANGIVPPGNDFIEIRSLTGNNTEAIASEKLEGRFWMFWWSPDGKFLATSSSSDKIKVWDAESGEAISEVRIQGETEDLQFADNGSIVAVVKSRRDLGEYKPTVISWKPGFEKELRELPLPDQICSEQVVISSSGRRIAVSNRTGRVCIYEFDNETGPQKRCELLLENGAAIREFSHDDSLLAIGTWGSSADRVSIINTKTGHTVKEWCPPGSTSALRFSPNGEELAVQGLNGVVYLLRVPEMKESKVPTPTNIVTEHTTATKTNLEPLEAKHATENAELRKLLDQVIADETTEREAFWKLIRKNPKGKHDPPFLRMAERLMKVANQAPNSAPGRDALIHICQTSDISGYAEHNRGLQSLRKQAAMELLNRHFIDPAIAKAVATICYTTKDRVATARRFIREHPDRQVQACAMMTLAGLYRNNAKYQNVRESSDVALSLYQRLAEQYGDLYRYEGGPTFREVAEKELKTLTPSKR